MFARIPGKGITLEMYIRNTQGNKKKKKERKKKETIACFSPWRLYFMCIPTWPRAYGTANREPELQIFPHSSAG